MFIMALVRFIVSLMLTRTMVLLVKRFLNLMSIFLVRIIILAFVIFFVVSLFFRLIDFWVFIFIF